MTEFYLDGKTKLVILIGNPVEHSMSPSMHTAAFQAIGFNGIYIACKVEKGMLKEAVEGLKALNILGANVTIPHKVEIMKYIDEIDPKAQDIGAINTIVNKNEILYATNTDGIAAIKSMKEAKFPLNGSTAVILGAGGAARAIAFYLLDYIDHLYLTNRHREKAEHLKNELSKKFDVKITIFNFNKNELKSTLKKSDILINCTPVGMYPNVDQSPVPKECLNKNLNVFDAIYNPIETKLIKEAKSLGANAIGGLKMFLYQGAEAFKLWTGKDAPISIMEKIIIKNLKK